MSYPPPPDQPGQPYPPYQPGPLYQPGPPRPSGNRRVAVIIAVCVAVAVLLCVGCGVAGAVFYLRSDDGDGATSGAGEATANPPALTSAAPAPLSCAATPLTDQPNIKTVGMPDFSKAPRTGTATMQLTTNLGPITIRMDRARTPCTVASFQHLADKKYFDQTKCHRLVTEAIFVLQCGDPSGTGLGRPDYQFADENLTGARYSRGVVAMANAGPGTNGSQFFIVFQDSPLNPLYTPFGSVTSGIAVVDQVAAGGNDGSLANSAGGGRPNIEITLQTVTVT
jgi:peptidyl-prolyl cis-trans isomerase B (cyclophilin B)